MSENNLGPLGMIVALRDEHEHHVTHDSRAGACVETVDPSGRRRCDVYLLAARVIEQQEEIERLRRVYEQPQGYAYGTVTGTVDQDDNFTPVTPRRVPLRLLPNGRFAPTVEP